mmetsp:Transcript_3886/g.10010  ORF Transcript_3886/g.10010 Transcript_3886/m.10010 type:complete len:525 (+) Transcript_3886:486-2060(+)
MSAIWTSSLRNSANTSSVSKCSSKEIRSSPGLQSATSTRHRSWLRESGESTSARSRRAWMTVSVKSQVLRSGGAFGSALGSASASSVEPLPPSRLLLLFRPGRRLEGSSSGRERSPAPALGKKLMPSPDSELCSTDKNPVGTFETLPSSIMPSASFSGGLLPPSSPASALASPSPSSTGSKNGSSCAAPMNTSPARSSANMLAVIGRTKPALSSSLSTSLMRMVTSKREHTCSCRDGRPRLPVRGTGGVKVAAGAWGATSCSVGGSSTSLEVSCGVMPPPNNFQSSGTNISSGGWKSFSPRKEKMPSDSGPSLEAEGNILKICTIWLSSPGSCGKRAKPQRTKASMNCRNSKAPEGSWMFRRSGTPSGRANFLPTEPSTAMPSTVSARNSALRLVAALPGFAVLGFEAPPAVPGFGGTEEPSPPASSSATDSPSAFRPSWFVGLGRDETRLPSSDSPLPIDSPLPGRSSRAKPAVLPGRCTLPGRVPTKPCSLSRTLEARLEARLCNRGVRARKSVTSSGAVSR